MSRNPLGFVQLAERLHERLSRAWSSYLRYDITMAPPDREYGFENLDAQTAGALEAIRDGRFRDAGALVTDLDAVKVITDDGEREECWVWRPFQLLCYVLHDLDALLATLEGRKGSADLARAARDDIDLLPILADWCEDHARPAAGAELRRLRTLLREAERFL